MGLEAYDYIDGDVAYLIGLIVARGTIVENSSHRRLIITFPFSSLKIQGLKSEFKQEESIKLGLFNIRERLLELLDSDVSIVDKENSIDLVFKFTRNSMVWRNILLLLDKATSYPYFKVPPIFLKEDIPFDYKKEFIKGYSDVAGNIRLSNRYVDGRNRVRLDVLNYKTNWVVPVQICEVLQRHLNIPVQLITWGHPNMGRDFREHQINIFAKSFLSVGFNFSHKQKLLEEFADQDGDKLPNADYKFCPGREKRMSVKKKDHDEGIYNENKLDPLLIGKHCDHYWQICKYLGYRQESMDVLESE